MQDKFSLNVNDQFHFELSKEQIDELDVLELNKDHYHLLKNNKSFETKIIASEFHDKQYSVEINGSLYEVKISNDLDLLIKAMGFEVGESKKVNAIYAPMPGLIYDIMVKKGDTVTEEQPLLILEAMKMENIISSPRDGVIKEVHITKGQAIEKKYLLIEFE